VAVCDASSKAKAFPSERPLTGSLFMSVASRFWPLCRDLHNGRQEPVAIKYEKGPATDKVTGPN
jgi:hypothetical protein